MKRGEIANRPGKVLWYIVCEYIEEKEKEGEENYSEARFS